MRETWNRLWIKLYVYADNTLEYNEFRYQWWGTSAEKAIYALNVKFKEGQGTYKVVDYSKLVTIRE